MNPSTPPPIERLWKWQHFNRELQQSKRELQMVNENRDILGEGMYKMNDLKVIHIDPLNPEGRKANNNIKREYFNKIL